MNDVQKNLFQLLVEFDEICKKHDIKYLLAAGASLGAIRNHCFMPWDDDIDLYISRDNWNKLRHIVETEENVIPEGRSLIYKENTPYYCNPLPRYVDNTNTTIYVSQALAGKACGQHLELFIFDPIPIGKEEEEKYLELLRVYTELVSPYFVVNKNASLEGWQKHYNLYKKYCDRADKEGEEKVLKELEEELQQYSIEECEKYCMRWGIKHYIYDKEHFEGKSEFETFEGKKFPVGTNTKSLLRVAYGDSWMYIPVTEEQISHNSIQSATRSFHEYTDRYIKKINRESVFKKYKKNKRNNASVFYYRRKVDMLVAKEKVAAKSKQIIKDLENEEYLSSLLKNKEYELLSEEFKEYSKLQMDSDVRKYNILVPISNKNLKIFLTSLIEQGKYYDANKYLNLYKKDGELSKELEEIENKIIVCRELSIARYDKEDEKLVESLINKYEKQYPNLLDIYRSKIWIKENNAKTCKDYKALDKLCEEILKTYPFDGEIIATQAKAKLEINQKDEAKKLYIKAINKTRNGLIWQKVEDEIGISRINIERDIINGIENEYIIKENKEIKTLKPRKKTKKEIELELLQEFDEICKENGLGYILFGFNSLNAYKNYTIKNNDEKVEVAMTQGDINRFCKIIENKNNENRYVEGTFNNPKYIPLYTSYGNKNTANFNVINFKTNIKHGIRIIIHPIFKSVNLDGTVVGWNSKLSKEEKIRKFLNKRVESDKLWYAKAGINIANKAYSTVRRRQDYHKQVKNYTFIDKWEDIQNYSKVRINNKIIPSFYLKETQKIEVDNIKITLPKDSDKYFKNIKFVKDEYADNPKHMLVDSELSYEDIIKETENILKEIKSTHENILLGRLKLLIDRKPVHNVWYLVEMTDKQLKFIDYFDENIDSLLKMNLNDKEEFEKVKKELNPVINTLKEYSKIGMTFSINPEIDQLIEKVLLKEGNVKLVKKIKKLREKEYFIE